MVLVVSEVFLAPYPLQELLRHLIMAPPQEMIMVLGAAGVMAVMAQPVRDLLVEEAELLILRMESEVLGLTAGEEGQGLLAGISLVLVKLLPVVLVVTVLS